MILNTKLFSETVEAAKQAASTSPAWLRAIRRAAYEIERAKYWSFDGSTLTIISASSGKLYKIADGHECDARGGVCKHRAARRLMVRYYEKLNAQPAQAVHHALAKIQAERIERARLIADINAKWTAKHPRQPIGLALLKHFGCNRLEMLALDSLEGVQRALMA
jgi:hypothetical protein